MSQAQSNSAFKWSHPSTNTASGFLATLAMFYAGSGKTRGLTAEDVLADKTAAYVSAVEKTVRYYGEGELAVIQRALQEGPAFLDAFVVQEQMVIYFKPADKNAGQTDRHLSRRGHALARSPVSAAGKSKRSPPISARPTGSSESICSPARRKSTSWIRAIAPPTFPSRSTTPARRSARPGGSTPPSRRPRCKSPART